MITIVDYGLGNLRSIQNMLRKVGVDAAISSEPDVIAVAARMILPGVGHFAYVMARHKNLAWPVAAKACANGHKRSRANKYQNVSEILQYI